MGEIIMQAIDLAFTQLKIDEGIRLKPYTDIKGKITIGMGRNLTDVGISQAESDYLASHDLQIALNLADEAVRDFYTLSTPRQAIIIQMAFNLGRKTLGEFTQFLDYIDAREYDKAADDLLNTTAAKELPARYGRYANIIRNGQ